MKEQHRIVVGVDGSRPSKAALAWAVRQAELSDAMVDAVIAWQYPIAFAGAPFAPIGSVMETDFAATAEQVLGDAISEIVDPAGPVKVSATVREGNPAQILLDVGNGADLLVVGSRGHGGFAEAARFGESALRPPRAVPSRHRSGVSRPLARGAVGAAGGGASS